MARFKKLKASETDILKSMLQYLAYRPGRYWRQNTGGAFFNYKTKSGEEKKQFVKYGVVGGGDISGLRPPFGQRVEIEVKVPGKKQRPSQKLFEQMIKDGGGLYIKADCLEDLINAGL